MSAKDQAATIAEAAADAWWSASAPEGIGVPIGVVAALMLVERGPDPEVDPEEQLLASSDEEIADALAEVWAMFTIVRPELAFRCGPFGEWLNAEPRDPKLVAAAGDVARAALKRGLFEHTAHRQVMQEADLLGDLFMRMKAAESKKKTGEFYTPPELAVVMATVTFGDLEQLKPGMSICDPTAGTGGLLRAAAEVLRTSGRDPADYRWFGNDIETTAATALAVNFHLWGLGRGVVVGCADALLEGDWEVRAANEQRAAIEAQQDRVKAAGMLAMLRSVDAAVDAVEDEAEAA